MPNFDGVTELNTGAYLPYDWETGRVDGLLEYQLNTGEVVRLIEPIFVERRRTKLADCEADVAYYRDEAQRRGLAGRTDQQNREQLAERAWQMSALSENVFTGTGLAVPGNVGGAVDYLLNEVRHGQESGLRSME